MFFPQGCWIRSVYARTPTRTPAFWAVDDCCGCEIRMRTISILFLWLQAPAVGLPPVGSLLAISGRSCYVPLKYNGTVINSCVKIHGNNEPVCWVKNEGWEVNYSCSLETYVSLDALFSTTVYIHSAELFWTFVEGKIPSHQPLLF